MAVGFGATVHTMSTIRLPKELKLRTLYTPDFQVPGSSYFYTDAWNFELSQPVLFHDLGRSIDNAKQADIIFVGNSRTQLGIREEFIVPLAEEKQLKVFSLGAGHSEGAIFGLDLIRKHDLRPKIVVIFGGAHIYHGRYSKVAQETMKMNRWDAMKLWGETALSWNVRYRMHRIIPKVDLFGRGIASRYIMYRSELSGWWKPAIEGRGNYKTRYSEGGRSYTRILPLVKEIRSELDSRGALLVASVIPYRDTDDQYLQYLHEAFGIPIVHPRLTDLETADGSHLNRQSAERFTNAFWREFMATEEVRERLGLK